MPHLPSITNQRKGAAHRARILAGWTFIGAALLSCLAAAGAAQRPAGEGSVDFSRDILPVLSDNCFQCHGPDEKARKAKLRLDTKEGAFRVKDGKTVIVPGKSAESELISRINSRDPEALMPPPESHHKLTPRQIDLIRRWVDEGAKWARHWAFKPIEAPKPPRVKNSRWPVNDIDRWILARLEREGLEPSPTADRERLLRRVTFDLTGLPPTVAELDAFLADKSSNAYEKVVDRLLNSPRYGERMAAPWLDLARYADTYGYQMDAARQVWPYRDWVIQAFNRNLRFDEFVTWQLAGDLLPGATREQRLATAFNRLHLQNEEGGIVEEEFRVSYVVDRVDTFGTAFLGLTLECSRCHDHKFDPITMRDFYSLFAFFQNIDEAGQNPYTGFVDYTPVPAMLLSDAATDERLAKLSRQIDAKEKQLGAMREAARGAFAEWLADKQAAPTVSGLVAAFSFDDIHTNKVANSADATKAGDAHEGPVLVEGRNGRAAELNGDNGFTFPGIGHFTRTDPFSIALWLQTPVHASRQVVLHHTKAPADAGSRGYELLLEEGRLAVGLHHMWPGNSIKVCSKAAIPTNEWVHVAFAYDGSSRAAGVRLFINGAPAEVEIVRDKLRKDITYQGGEPDLAIGYRFRDAGFKGGKVDDFKVFNRALTTLEMAEIAGRDSLRAAWQAAPEFLSHTQRDGLLEYYLANVYPPARQFLADLTALRREQSRAINPIPEIMAMEEMATPKPAYILKRGAYDAHGEPVAADTPKVLPPFPADAPRNRLGLARWLVSPENPLLARVTVNRAWQLMFGRGIVETSDNFGAQGAVPSHPQLLDWLAGDFMAAGWNYKALLKKIAMSATYRQNSKATPDLLARDPDNRWLARGPARRLTAEMLRDQALAASGLQAEKVGGPSVKPYQPPGLWEIAMENPKYDQGHGDDLHRRSLYTFWKRTVPPPAMLAFDAPERNVCVVRRQSTSTPLQSLALLNDTQIVEAARFVAERMLKEGGSTRDDQIAWAFRLVTSRHPTSGELALLTRLFQEQHALFARDQQAAAKLLAVGEQPNDPALSPVDLAAGSVLAETLFNHDEAVMRR
jgi:mono/diheme cytochrome c family protein